MEPISELIGGFVLAVLATIVFTITSKPLLDLYHKEDKENEKK